MNLDINFINDHDVIGKWEIFDVINNKKDFNTSIKQNFEDVDFKEIYFMPNGQKYWIFEGWTKNNLYIHYGGDEPILNFQYELINKDNNMYMFLYNVDIPNVINVFIKMSDKKYSISDFARYEKIDYPFVLDENVLGEWKSVDFIDKLEDFNPNRNTDEYWLKKIIFKDDGIVYRCYGDITWKDLWTKNLLLDQKKHVASSYEIRNINNEEYLIVEWKMENYIYGGRNPSYYVFKRNNK